MTAVPAPDNSDAMSTVILPDMLDARTVPLSAMMAALPVKPGEFRGPDASHDEPVKLGGVDVHADPFAKLDDCDAIAVMCIRLVLSFLS